MKWKLIAVGAGNARPVRISGSQNRRPSTPSSAKAAVTTAADSANAAPGPAPTGRSAQTDTSLASPRAAAAKPWFWPAICASSWPSAHSEHGVGRSSWSALTWPTIVSVILSARRSSARMSVMTATVAGNEWASVHGWAVGLLRSDSHCVARSGYGGFLLVEILLWEDAAAGSGSVCGLPYLFKALEDDVELPRAVEVFEDRVVEGALHYLWHGIGRVEADAGGLGEIRGDAAGDRVRVVAERYQPVHRYRTAPRTPDPRLLGGGSCQVGDQLACRRRVPEHSKQVARDLLGALARGRERRERHEVKIRPRPRMRARPCLGKPVPCVEGGDERALVIEEAPRRAGEHRLAGLPVAGDEHRARAAMDDARHVGELAKRLPRLPDRCGRPRQRARHPPVIGLRTGLVQHDVLDPVGPRPARAGAVLHSHAPRR